MEKPSSDPEGTNQSQTCLWACWSIRATLAWSFEGPFYMNTEYCDDFSLGLSMEFPHIICNHPVLVERGVSSLDRVWDFNLKAGHVPSQATRSWSGRRWSSELWCSFCLYSETDIVHPGSGPLCFSLWHPEVSLPLLGLLTGTLTPCPCSQQAVCKATGQAHSLGEIWMRYPLGQVLSHRSCWPELRVEGQIRGSEAGTSLQVTSRSIPGLLLSC